MKKVFTVLAVFALVLALSVPAFASSNHAAGCLRWTYEGTTYGIAPYYSVNRESYPIYITWDDGIVIMFDADDCSGKPQLCYYDASTPMNYTLNNSNKYTMTKVDDGVKTYYMYKFSTNYELYGLDFSSLATFQAGLDDDMSVYYLPSISSDWSDAVNFSSYSISSSLTFEEVLNAQAPGFLQSVLSQGKTVLLVGIAVLAFVIVIPLIPKVFYRFF